MGSSNWNKMTNWYDSMVGDEGHKYHRDYAIPTILKLLNPQKDQLFLDAGCGQGILSPYITRSGGKYIGFDPSDQMIRNAIARHSNNGIFFCEKIENINNNSKVQGKFFDGITFLFSIQDIKNIEEGFKNVSKLLKPDGKIIIFMMHPCFRIPRQSGWGEDKKRKLIYRRLDRYLSAGVIPLDVKVRYKGKKITSYFYHRPLNFYFELFKKNNLFVENLIEIPEQKPGYSEFPTFLALSLKKNKVS
ncbi:hypothetical protein A2V49_02785 [candidate division WWE3 bacterium RBG_19FT_COMBO_34_6]|uniref:Uncharacterized protein n=1 Tax=candidate division WWE3 bacterium RBG_19FT_COMBO_34_6 TaxID=1802612 RepID=A0A1F4UN82_UNCKA|nr:MAG: hypothetical protein A2V49_02785 [candidate division WWE3 bacterium RBG_19FT_COMBO_34_6]